MDDDEQLWEQVESGDETAWARLVQRHWKPIRRFFINRVGDDADDLTQTTFRRLQERRSHFAKRGSLRAFVFGIARYVLLEHVRNKRRDEKLELGDISAAALDPRPSSILCQRREQRLILEALRHLKLDHQIVLELHYWESMTDREIGEILEVSVNTVRSRISRARAILRELVEGLERQEPLPSTSADLETWMHDMRRLWNDGQERPGKPQEPAAAD